MLVNRGITIPHTYLVAGNNLLLAGSGKLYRSFTTKQALNLFVKVLRSQGFKVVSKVAWDHALDMENAFFFGEKQHE